MQPSDHTLENPNSSDAGETPAKYEEFLVGSHAVEEIKQIAARCPDGSDVSDKLATLQQTTWSLAKAGMQRNGQGGLSITHQEYDNLQITIESLEGTVAAQKEDLQDFQSQLPVVQQAQSPKNLWKRFMFDRDVDGFHAVRRRLGPNP